MTIYLYNAFFENIIYDKMYSFYPEIWVFFFLHLKIIFLKYVK